MRFYLLSFILATTLATSVLHAEGIQTDPDSHQSASKKEVSFPGEGLTLEGTLHLPERNGPTAAAVLVHGSGPHDRRQVLSRQLGMGFGIGIPVFEEIAVSLQEAGIAVLTYDKRTCFQGNGCGQNDYPAPSPSISILDFAADAASALYFLSHHPGIDGERIFVIGHSQGGHLVPEILTRFPQAAGGIILAGNFSPIDELLSYQVDFLGQLLEDSGMAPAQIELNLRQTRSMAEGAAKLKQGEYDGSALGGAPVSFWESLFELTSRLPDQVLALEVPLLVLGGDYDTNVPPAEIRKWQELFDSLPAPRAPAATRVLPCLTHALNCITQPDPHAIQVGDIGRRVDPAVIREIVGFMAD